MPSLGSSSSITYSPQNSSKPSPSVSTTTATTNTTGTIKRRHSSSSFVNESSSSTTSLNHKTIDSFFRKKKDDHQPPSQQSSEFQTSCKDEFTPSHDSSRSDQESGPILKKQKTAKTPPKKSSNRQSSSSSPLCTGPLDLLFQKQKQFTSSQQSSSSDSAVSCSDSELIKGNPLLDWEHELTKLDDTQRQAVHENSAKYLLINGSPGCGKTLVVALRALQLLRTDPTRKILILTFSKKAEQEIHARIFKFTGFKSNQQHRIHVKTIHAFAFMIMRKFGDENRKTIANEQQILEIFKKSPKFQNVQDDKFKELLSWCQEQRAKGNTSSDFIEGTEKDFLVWYQDELLKKCLTLDSLIEQASQVLQTEKKAIQFCSQFFTDLFVDEFQDTSFKQYDLLKLASNHDCLKNITVFGDQNQSIYSFIGSNGVRLFQQFKIDFENVQTIDMMTNYRSNTELIKIANYFMRTDTRKGSSTITENTNNYMVRKFGNFIEEIEFITREIQKLVNNGVSLSSICVLFRRDKLQSILEETLIRKNIKVASPVKDKFLVVLKILKLMIGEGKEYTEKEEDLIFIVKNFKPYMDGIGEKTVQSYLNGEKPTKKSARLSQFIQTLIMLRKNLFATLGTISLPTLCDYMLQNFKDVKVFADEDYIRQRISAYSTETASLCALRDIEACWSSDDNRVMTEGVVLSTIHRAKGLEFDIVFIPEVHDGVMPLQKNVHDAKKVPDKQCEQIDESEERRIFYVAITRAKQCLYLTHVEKSQFITQIDSFLKQSKQ
ncbi:hypothetical protein C9374_012276 [Naegleria lovaniensis]|uniref:DNA 3'-5' helicase n=1 Tax=Naegleria lovaniensis TaxID=51637 RepID=A0AA88GCY1_NAELO|nr:uncharacterized protein C9374_012276 [Naegleria lovaniensis]KAG2373287.1 hypothetical protein C9374_012276 [Naegleria lovaniensis]